MKGKCMSLMPMMMVPMGSLAQPAPMLAWMQRPAGTPCGPSRPGSPPPPCFATASSTGTWVPSEIGLWNFQKPFNLFSLSFYHSDTGRQNSCMERFFFQKQVGWRTWLCVLSSRRCGKCDPGEMSRDGFFWWTPSPWLGQDGEKWM